MGYLSTFEIETKGEYIGDKTILNDLVADFLGEDGFSPFEDQCKWYDYDTDMAKFSLQYPNTVFIVTRSGEEYPDFEKTIFYRGKHTTSRAEVKITYEPFDMSELDCPIAIE